MAKYQANPVIVDAFKIVSVDSVRCRCMDSEHVHEVTLKLEDGSTAHATREMTARMTPQVGDYWVIQSDGYVYLNPKDVFERKYSPVEPNALELGAEVRRLGLAGS